MCSTDEKPSESTWFSEWYPPDYDHGGNPLLGSNPSRWDGLLEGVVFLDAACSMTGDVILVLGRVERGFVEVIGQFVKQGQPLHPKIASSLTAAHFRIPVSMDATRQLGIEIELGESGEPSDWRAEAYRMELEVLSTISRIASFGCSADLH